MRQHFKRVPITLLATPKPRWGAFGSSAAMQCAAVLLLVWLPMLFPQKLYPKKPEASVHLVTPLVAWEPHPPVRVKQPTPPLPPPVKERLIARLVAPPP